MLHAPFSAGRSRSRHKFFSRPPVSAGAIANASTHRGMSIDRIDAYMDRVIVGMNPKFRRTFPTRAIRSTAQDNSGVPATNGPLNLKKGALANRD